MLEIATQMNTDIARVALVGEIDLASTQSLEDALVRVERTEPEHIIVDLGELSFLDVTGLHVFLEAAKRAEWSGISSVFVRAEPAVARLLFVSGAHEELYLSDEDDDLSAIR